MSGLRKHLSLANVLSATALFVALGGSAYAATRLAPNQVRTVNIAREAVTQPKLRASSVTSGKIANGQVNSRDLANGGVTAAKLGKKSVGAAALAAEAVSTGKLGRGSVSIGKLAPALALSLVRNVTYITETSPLDSEDAKSTTAFCPVGKEVIGGGVRIAGEGADKVVPTESSPNASLHLGWTASAREIEGKTSGNWSVSAFAVCAEL